MNYKSVSIYVTAKDEIFILPRGVSEKWGGATIDLEIYHLLENSYTDEQLEAEVLRAFEEWNSIKPNDALKPTAIEKFLKINGYLKAVKGMKYINIGWNIDDGYYVVPTANSGKKGFIHIEDETIRLGKSINNGELVVAIKAAIDNSK
jgi:hypothetical protein